MSLVPPPSPTSPVRHSKPSLHILIGIPGCGKSTYAEQLDGEVISTDALRKLLAGDETIQDKNDLIFRVFHNTLGWGLQEGFNMVADSTALTPRARKQLRDVAAYAGADTHVHLFRNNLEAFRRNQQRERVVPDHVMQRMLSQYEDTIIRLPQELYTSVTEIKAYR